MKKLFTILTFCVCILFFNSQAQNNATVFNPADVVTFLDPNSPKPLLPPNNNNVYKWYATKKVNWNSQDFKAYILNGLNFRIRYPENYNPSDTTKKYPVILFLHGKAEVGDVYDNDQQLYNGGYLHNEAVKNKVFDGFLIYPQNTGIWGYSQFERLSLLINIMSQYTNIDVDRVNIHGLSMGGRGTIDMLVKYPKLFSSSLPMSVGGDWGNYNSILEIPMWVSQGALDKTPTPSYTEQAVNTFSSLGGNIIYTLYPNLGHAVWDETYKNPDFFPFINRAHKANPTVYFGRTEFCPEDVINVKLGLTAGFDGYEWRKDGVLISGATTHQLNVTQLGTYEARIKRGTKWSVWSPKPVVIKAKGLTTPPQITVLGNNSKFIPSGNGSTTVTLTVAEGFERYEWFKTGSTSVLSSTNQLTVSQPGEYYVKIKEKFGCSPANSSPFTVQSANSSQSPDPASNLSANAVSKTQINLTWSNNTSPLYNETGFELYRSTTSNAGFNLIKIIPADVLFYADSLLSADTKYFYKIRAINDNGASAVSNEVFATTLKDNNPPSTPGNLRITSVNRSVIEIAWEPSSDDIGVAWYDIYLNGQKLYSTEADNTNFVIGGLTYGTIYTIQVVAKDISNNLSSPSNQVTAKTVNKGFNYKYYESAGAWNTLPNFASLTPVKTGSVENIDLSVRARNNNYGLLFEGFINIPVSGNYTFETYSDDGSKLYIGNYDHAATALVNNDGSHGFQYREGTINLTKGIHPIAVTYFQSAGNFDLKVFWKNTAHGVVNREQIPAQFFTDEENPLPKPASPTQINAIAVGSDKVNVSWIDQSIDETGFEVYRSKDVLGPFAIIDKVDANVNSYDDTKIEANTTYYYKVKAINNSGESALSGKVQDFTLNFNNNFEDQSGFNRNVTPLNNPSFTTVDIKEGTHALSLDGSDDFVDIGGPNPGYLHTAFNSRSISLWYKPLTLNSARVLLDLGNYDNGLGLRTNGTELELGIAGNNNRRVISTPVVENTWYHIVLVYHNNTLKLYKNGTLVGSILDLPFTSVAATSDPSRIGQRNNNNAFNSNSYFPSKGIVDAFVIYENALSADEIESLYNLRTFNAKVTTNDLPDAPDAPENLSATLLAGNHVNLKWNFDSANSTISYALYRSKTDSSSFVKVWEGAASAAGYTDSALVGNMTFYYKLKAVNTGGESEFSKQVAITTQNSAPILASIANKTLRFDEPGSVNISATDADNDAVNFSIINDYGFITIEQTTANAGKLNINPTSTSVGSYTIDVIGTDSFGAKDTSSFVLTINQNYSPIVTAPVNNLSLKEGEIKNVNIVTKDQNTTDQLDINLSSTAPNFASIIPLNDSTSTLQLKPSFSDSGNYSFFVKVSDGNGGIDSTQISINVTDVNPGYKIYVNFTKGATPQGYWNNTTEPVNRKVFSNFITDKMQASTVGITVTSDWQTWWNASNNNGMWSSALFPAFVTNTTWSVNNGSQSFKITGLSNSLKYDLSFLSSNKSNNLDYTTTVTSGATSASINSVYNVDKLITLKDLKPNEDGEISVTVSSKAGGVAQISAMVINASLSSSTPPANPKDFIAAYDYTSKKVKLTWTDVAFDETGYEVFRSVNGAEFTKVITTVANVKEYLDGDFKGSASISYKVRAINGVGVSEFTDVIEVFTPNRIPSITSISDLEIKAEKLSVVTINVADDETDILTVSGLNLPAFATLSEVVDGQAQLSFNPTITDVKNYKDIVIQISDNFGGISKDTFNLNVIDSTLVSIQINFNRYSSAASPWNNTASLPTANLSITNLKNSFGESSNLSMTLLNAWSNANEFGVVTGDNSGLYPDNVLKTNYYDNSTEDKQIKISGLQDNKRYSFIFFASWRNPWSKGITKYSVGTNTVILDPTNNTNRTVQINNITGDENGDAIITISKETGSSFVFINSLVIKEYNFTGIPFTPENLVANGVNRTNIKLSWDDMSDNEDGFEIYRSMSENGTYSLIHTTAPSVNSYEDNNLNSNTAYWYKIRAIRADGKNSGYTNQVIASTRAYSIAVNFNREDPAPAPWNNTNKNPQDGDRFNFLLDDSNTSSSISLTMIDNFTGANNLGVVTGSNSGKYPDVVNKWFYYSEKNETTRIKFSGLNQTMAYDLEFFGSWQYPFANGNTSYTVNGEVVYLNPENNTTKTVSINNITPNSNGEIFIDIFMPSESQYAFLNAIFLHAHAKLPNIVKTGMVVDNGGNMNELLDIKALSNDNLGTLSTVYPNPFENKINVKLSDSFTNSNEINVQVVDLNGSVLKASLINPNGSDIVELDLQEANLKTGVYLLRIKAKGIKEQSLRIIKK